MKICELAIQDMQSVTAITHALLLNGYNVKISTKFKEYPRETQIDYFNIEISNDIESIGGEQNAK